MRTPVLVFAVAWVCACGPQVVASDGGGDSTGAADTTSTSAATLSTSTSTSGGTTATSVGTSVGSSSSTSADSTTSDDGSDTFVFVNEFDAGDFHVCDVWLQDCPRGEKCMPWANDGGSNWNATRCTPIAPDPHTVGEPCLVEGSGVSGIDDCDLGAMCWDVDPDTLAGTCVAMCTGDEANPHCEGACEECTLTDAGVLNLCLPACDPLNDTCEADETCAPWFDVFLCAPQVPMPAGLAEPCEYINDCAGGLLCLQTDLVPDCQGGSGCCAPVCDTEAPDGCDAMLPGTECQAWYAQPPDNPCIGSNVGVCSLP
ncbi:MAG: hypothetical protein K1X88_02030 [Nannocystaceae bacterium]|nr:hypothetical protein [Nannocystaceae bacterium]